MSFQVWRFSSKRYDGCKTVLYRNHYKSITTYLYWNAPGRWFKDSIVLSPKDDFYIIKACCGDSFHITIPLCEEATCDRGSPHKGPVMPIFEVLVVLNLYKLLNKQSSLSQTSRRTCDITVMVTISGISISDGEDSYFGHACGIYMRYAAL